MSNFIINKSSSNAGLPDPISTRIIYMRESDVGQWPAVTADGVTVTADIVLRPGIVAGEIYVTPKTQEGKITTDGDIDMKGSVQVFTASHPGDSTDIASFIEQYKNEGLILLVPHASGAVRVYGWRNNPLFLSDELVNGATGVTHQLTFTSSYPANVPYYYQGAMPEVAGEATDTEQFFHQHFNPSQFK